jgi:hypothetical protein
MHGVSCLLPMVVQALEGKMEMVNLMFSRAVQNLFDQARRTCHVHILLGKAARSA